MNKALPRLARKRCLAWLKSKFLREEGEEESRARLLAGRGHYLDSLPLRLRRQIEETGERRRASPLSFSSEVPQMPLILKTSSRRHNDWLKRSSFCHLHFSLCAELASTSLQFSDHYYSCQLFRSNMSKVTFK